MLHIEATTATNNLKIRRSMARLFQAYLYTILPSKEHNGYIHQATGKRFKSTNFRIIYHDNKFNIFFTSLNLDYEQSVAINILKNSLKLGDVRLSDVKVSLSRYIAWKAQYVIKADFDMINLLVKIGMGSDTMKNLGFLEVV